MDAVRRAVELGRAARAQAAVKMRQPLRRAVIVAGGAEREAVERLAELVRGELNVKELEFVSDEAELVSYRVRAQLPQPRPAVRQADAPGRRPRSRRSTPSHVAEARRGRARGRASSRRLRARARGRGRQPGDGAARGLRGGGGVRPGGRAGAGARRRASARGPGARGRPRGPGRTQGGGARGDRPDHARARRGRGSARCSASPREVRRRTRRSRRRSPSTIATARASATIDGRELRIELDRA